MAFNVIAHIKRYHKDYFRKCLDDAKKQAQFCFQQYGGNLVHVPFLTPYCKKLEALFPGGAYFTLDITREMTEWR